MADNENTVGREEINSSDVNNEISNEVISNADAFEHVDEGEEKNEQRNEEENSAASEKKEADAAEVKADASEAKASSQEAKAASNIRTGYSSYYRPPYYTPNFVTVKSSCTKIPQYSFKLDLCDSTNIFLSIIDSFFILFCNSFIASKRDSGFGGHIGR